MTSTVQLAANRANSQHSTGPKSQAGKQRTRLNAYRHGLTGQVCISTHEDRTAFDRHCDGIRQALEPVGAFELDLVQSIAEDRWRLKRARSLESGIFALGQSVPANTEDLGQVQIDEALAQARTWLADGKHLQLLTLYEQRIQRGVEKNVAQLKELQATRRAAAQVALQEAKALAQLAYSNAEDYNPEAEFSPQVLRNGFDYSPAAINRLILRERRLEEGNFGVANGWDAKYPYRSALQIPTEA